MQRTQLRQQGAPRYFSLSGPVTGCHLQTHTMKVLGVVRPRTPSSGQKAMHFSYWVEKPSVVDREKTYNN